MGTRAASQAKPGLLAIAVAALAVALWAGLSAMHLVPESVFPSPRMVAYGFIEEARSGRLLNDIVVSLFRVGIGFGLAVLIGIPIGLTLGHHRTVREAVSPAINFFRSLSPLAWIPFAILWFGVGDLPAIFLIFLASVFPLILATMVAVLGIPSVYFRVAYEHRIRGWALISHVTFPAVLPQVITALRVTAGLAWLVVVAAEMVAGRDGLGFAILDARNGLRTDLVVVGMIVIGTIGIILDRVLASLTQIPSVRWGYER
jgi:NitT/TauT family transport system permease protein